MAIWKTGLGKLLADRSGNVLPIAASGIVVMAALVGGGIDMSRAYRVQNRLQSACDAGVLAGRRAVTNAGFDTVARNQANSYFNINYDENQQDTHNTSFQLTADAQGNSVTGTASTQMDMLVMQLFDFGTMELEATCQSTMGVGNSDVTMVLDVTGSMGSALGSGTRLSALKTAMKNFYTTVQTATQGSNARIRYSFVPFSTTVNVGRLLYDLDPDYIRDSWTIQSRAPVFDTITEQILTGYGSPVNSTSSQTVSTGSSGTTRLNNTQYSSQSSCNAALPAASAWANDGAPYTYSGTTINGSGQQVVTTTTEQDQRQTAYVCKRSGSRYYVYYYYNYRTNYSYSYATSNPIYETRTRTVFSRWNYSPVLYDTSVFKTFTAVSTNTGTNGAAVSSTWDGCIEERSTVATANPSYSSVSGMTPSDALDLDIDSAPTSDEATKWAPLWRQVAYTRSTVAPSTSGSSATSYCVTPAKALDEFTQSEFNTYADSLTANGNTYLDIGMLWGARLANPDGIFGDLVNDPPANGGNVNRHIIFMTDGLLEPSNSIYQAYGIENLDQRVTGGSTSQATSRHSLRFRAVCDAVKAKGIRIWAIGFTTGLTSDLAYCASSGSSFTANDAAQLNAAFQEIAKQVGELRVLQ